MLSRSLSSVLVLLDARLPLLATVSISLCSRFWSSNSDRKEEIHDTTRSHTEEGDRESLLEHEENLADDYVTLKTAMMM